MYLRKVECFSVLRQIQVCWDNYTTKHKKVGITIYAIPTILFSFNKQGNNLTMCRIGASATFLQCSNYVGATNWNLSISFNSTYHILFHTCLKFPDSNTDSFNKLSLHNKKSNKE